MTLQETIGANVKRMREALGWSQNKLAFFIYGRNCNPVVSRWEKGEFCPNAFALKGLSEAFGCTIDELFREVQDAKL